ncbi:MAG: phenylacetate-CoA oxygenase subunit PaaC [Bacteroidota bacterium]|jgi:ring-1,2-phenylacetyl-CoA epoxidase subunit PaaC
MTDQINYLHHLGDNALIYSHRLSEWCGHGPELEIDMALSNIALDSIGAARSFYQYAAELAGNNATEDTIVYQRNEREYKNVILVEQPNGDFAHTIARCLFFDAFQKLLYTQMQHSSDKQLAAIAAKSLKEVSYHERFSSEWTIRLGDGTAESKQRMQAGIDYLYPYTGELFLREAYEHVEGAVDCAMLKAAWRTRIAEVLAEADLVLPADGWSHSGGKRGVHSEHMGYLLSEMQYLNRAYPGATW